MPARALAWVLSATLVVTSVVALSLATPLAASANDGTTPAVSANPVNSHGKGFILAGEDASIAITVTNGAGDDKYNLSMTALVPSGIDFISASLIGTPKRYPAGTPLPNASRTGGASPAPDCAAPLVPVGTTSPSCTAPAGFELWVWENVADLPDTATIESTLTVRPSTTTFPVGTDDLDVVVTAYTSGDETLLPAFDGSTTMTTSTGHTSLPGTASTSTEVQALRVIKSEPSLEQELLRGVHRNTTTYTIRVQNSGQGVTGPVTVVDFLPAGLEYLGNGNGDNTTDANGTQGVADEYPGSGPLGTTSDPSPDTGDWSGTDETVETVIATAADAAAYGLVEDGVYTKVTWTIGDLSGGTAQAYPGASGTPGEYVIRYAAGIPLFENTMDWPGSTPGINGGQTANLDNNTGPSTRHGLDEADYDPPRSLTNVAAAAGQYQGAIAPGGDAQQSDHDRVSVEAVDLRVVKTVDEGDFVTGALRTYTLNVATSEYTSASGITLTDSIANGLCPAFPAQTTPYSPTLLLDGTPVSQEAWNAAVSPSGTECDYPYTGGGASVDQVVVDSIDFDSSTGGFVVEFSSADVGVNLDRDISYTVLQRANYTNAGSKDGATSSGDVMRNDVEIRGTTHSIPALDGVVSASGAEAFGDETVLDTSYTEIGSSFTELRKKVLERDLTPSTADDGTWADTPDPDYGDWVDYSEQPFALGDSVWYRVRIDFAHDIETRNPRLTDFLPQGVQYVGTTYSWDLPGVSSGSDLVTPDDDFIGAPTISGNMLRWQLGDQIFDGSTDRFIPIGSWIEFTIEARVVGQSASVDDVDQPQNQAKYRQENVEGDVFFLRDDALTDLDHGLSLVKGIRDINGQPTVEHEFASNVDGLQVEQGDEVTYRIDITAPESDTQDLVIWDALPPGVQAADVDPDSLTAATTVQVDGGSWSESALTNPTGFTAQIVDPGDLTYPANVGAEFTGRSLIVWTITATVPGSDTDDDPALSVARGLTLRYTVTIPDGSVATGGPAAEIAQDYVNDASIVRYDVVNNNPATGGFNGDNTSTLVPQGPGTISSALPTGDQRGIASDGTFDPSSVHMPDAGVDKVLVNTEVGPTTPDSNGTVGLNPIDGGNSQRAIVQGELATFRYTVTIPAHSSVTDGVLRDQGVLRWSGNPNVSGRQLPYQFVSATVDYPSAIADPDAAGFAFDDDSGALTFPSYYQNSTDADQEFSVDITVWLEEGGPVKTPDLLNSTTLTNTAQFAFQDPNTGDPANPITDTSTVTYIEPQISVTKEAGKTTDISPSDTITYTIIASNASGRPTSYDNRLVDIVPDGVIVNPNSISHSGVLTDADPDTGGGTITWPVIDEIQAGQSHTRTYQATVIDTTGGGQTYTNTVGLTGHTLPDSLPSVPDAPDAEDRRDQRVSSTTETITALSAAVAKGVRVDGSTNEFAPTASAPIGEMMEYQVDITLHADINYFEPRIVDDLPAGVVLNTASVVGPTEIDDDGNPVSPGTITGTWTPTWNEATNTHTWTYSDGGGNDILHAPVDRTLRLTYTVDLTNDVPNTVNALTNTARLIWNTTDGGTPIATPPQDSATVTVLNPALHIVKNVEGQDQITRNPDATFDYTVTVSQLPAGNTPAYNVTVTDVVPAGVMVDTAQAALTGATFSNAANINDGLGGTISWQIPGPLYQTGAGTPTSVEFTYEANFVDSDDLTSNAAGAGPWLLNAANVTGFESFERDAGDPDTPVGRVYTPPLTGAGSIRDTAQVRVVFPAVTLTKTATSTTTAYAGEPFGWTLTLVNTGQGPAQTIDVTDVLPANWDFDTGTAQISVGGMAAVPLEAPTQTPGTGADAGKTLLTWNLGDAAPASPLVPGSASGATTTLRTIIVTFTATPQNPAALTDAGVTLANGTFVPHVNTLRAITTDTTGAGENRSRSHTGNPSNASAFIHSADLTIEKVGASAPLVAGTSGTGWTITVENDGPDTAVGPITVSDAIASLPPGIVITGASGTGWVCDIPVRDGTTGATSFDCARTNANESLVSGASFPPITVAVTVSAEQPPFTTAANLATVNPGATHDPNLVNNESDDPISTTTSADLSIAKTVTSPPPPAVPNVADTITWGITASNLGPSASTSTAPDDLITITDTVPAGVTGVTATSNGDWSATASNGWPAVAGDTVTWTYTGAAMPLGATAQVSLTGTILTSHTGTLTNAAVVHPGATEDPDYVADPLDPDYSDQNNYDDVTVTPGDATTLTITKTRVVPDGDGWRQADPANEDDAFVAGDPVHYLVDVLNNGPADARDVIVVDEVPTGLTYDSHENLAGTWTRTAGGTTNEGTNPAWDTFTLTGTQAPGEGSRTQFVVTYDTLSTITTDITNWVEVTAQNWDLTDPSGPYDRDSDRTGSTRIVDLGIAKTHAGTGPFTPGTEVTYTLTVTNHGPSATNGSIEIEDSLPTGMSYVENSATVTVPGSSPVLTEPTLSGTDDRVLTWEVLGTTDVFDVTDQIVVSFSALIDPLIREAVPFTNDVEVEGPETEPFPDPNPNTDDDTIVTGPTEATFTIGKDVSAGPWIAGEDVTYTVTVANDGPSAAPAQVTDTLPAGLSIVSMSGTVWDCSAVIVGAPDGTCDYSANSGLHPVGESEITVVARIATNVLPGPPVLTNEAEVSWTDGGGTRTDEDTAGIVVTTSADLGIVKDVIDGPGGDVIADPAPATAGSTAWFRLQVTNYGPSDAAGPVVVTDLLPLGVTVPSTLTSVGPWTVTTATVGAQQEVTFTVTAGQAANTTDEPTRGIAPVIEFEVALAPDLVTGTTLTNEADVTSLTPDPNPDNNDDDAGVVVERSADLAVVKSHPSDSDGRVTIDEPLDFTIEVRNNGPSEATGVQITDTVPSGLEVTSIEGPVAGTAWTIDSITLVDPTDPLGGAVVVASYATELGVDAATSSADPLVISTIVRESAYGTDPNHVDVAGNEPDPVPGNNEFEDPLNVIPRVTLITTKTAVGAFQVGETGTYRITVTNTGPHDDPGPILVEDVLPDGLTFASSPDDGVSQAGQAVTWTIPALAVGDTVVLTLVVDIHEAAYPIVTNTVTVSSHSELTPESVTTADAIISVAAADPLSDTGGVPNIVLIVAALLLLLAGGAAIALRRRRVAH